jgi:tetratricopeptide (TPR) repeat protein
MTLIIDDEVWMPVEITLLGSSDFMDAWRTGMDEWKRYANETGSRGFYPTRAAQEVFRPVSLTQRDLGLQYVQTEDDIQRDFEAILDSHTRTVVAAFREEAEESGDPRSYNRYGIVAAQLGRSAEARRAFNSAVRLAPDSLDPRINLGSLLFLEEDYRQALRVYRDALDLSERARRIRPSTRVTLLINMSRVHYQMEQFDDAERFFELASSVDTEMVREFSYLAQASDQQGARASGADQGNRILFSEMEPGEGGDEE